MATIRTVTGGSVGGTTPFVFPRVDPRTGKKYAMGVYVKLRAEALAIRDRATIEVTQQRLNAQQLSLNQQRNILLGRETIVRDKQHSLNQQEMNLLQ